MRAHKTTVGQHPLAATPPRASGSAKERAKGSKAAASVSPPETHDRSLTAMAAEAMKRENLDETRADDAIPRDVHAAGPDQSFLENDGDDGPAGSLLTPDYNAVDEVGRVYGIQEEDSGALRSSSEILDGRDHHRPELIPPRTREE